MQLKPEPVEVVMIRHAQSEWNRQQRFTGWANPPLTDAGRDEAVAAALQLASAGYRFDRAYTSDLVRAVDTAALLLRHSGNAGVPMQADWRLNERHYGALQGLDKTEVSRQVGDAQVWRWRRGYLDRPPPANRSPGTVDPVPNGESLADTRVRVLDFWHKKALPRVRAGQRLLVASHGNTLRALLMGLQDMSIDAVEAFEIPTGTPIVYRFSVQGQPRGWHYLSNPRVAA